MRDLVGGIPLEELLFGFSFGWYWTGVYEPCAWNTSVMNAGKHGLHPLSSVQAARKDGVHRRDHRPTVTGDEHLVVPTIDCRPGAQLRSKTRVALVGITTALRVRDD